MGEGCWRFVAVSGYDERCNEEDGGKSETGCLMDNGRFQLHRLARMMFSQLSPSEQAALLAKVGQLVELPRAEWLAHDARLISAADSLYLVNIDG